MTLPKVTFQSSVIFVSSIERAKAFYIDLLQQEIELDFGTCITLKCGLSLWQMDSTHIIAQSRQNQSPEKVNRFELCFETDDVKAMQRTLEESEIEFLHKMQEESWGQRTIRFYDQDDHLIEVGEYLNIFVKRLYNELGSKEKVHKKTSVPIEKIKEIIELD